MAEEDKTAEPVDVPMADSAEPAKLSDIGLYGLGVMGQNMALNIAEKGFTISVCNRSDGRVRITRHVWAICILCDSNPGLCVTFG